MLAKLRIRTSNGEEIKLNNVDSILIDGVNNNMLDKTVFIVSKKGNVTFDLDEITSISFDICGEQRILSVSSFISAKAVE